MARKVDAKKVLAFRIPDDLKRDVGMMALYRGQSLQEWVTQTLTRAVQAEKRRYIAAESKADKAGDAQ